jgi:hypothetical protein
MMMLLACSCPCTESKAPRVLHFTTSMQAHNYTRSRLWTDSIDQFLWTDSIDQFFLLLAGTKHMVITGSHPFPGEPALSKAFLKVVKTNIQVHRMNGFSSLTGQPRAHSFTCHITCPDPIHKCVPLQCVFVSLSVRFCVRLLMYECCCRKLLMETMNHASRPQAGHPDTN